MLVFLRDTLCQRARGGRIAMRATGVARLVLTGYHNLRRGNTPEALTGNALTGKEMHLKSAHGRKPIVV